ncbi:MAG: hypothetical protein IPH04_11775 [Saprospirales bacterium]|nr:hypothetical protein [Saprospirales bacterium]
MILIKKSIVEVNLNLTKDDINIYINTIIILIGEREKDFTQLKHNYAGEADESYSKIYKILKPHIDDYFSKRGNLTIKEIRKQKIEKKCLGFYFFMKIMRII